MLFQNQLTTWNLGLLADKTEKECRIVKYIFLYLHYPKPKIPYLSDSKKVSLYHARVFSLKQFVEMAEVSPLTKIDRNIL